MIYVYRRFLFLLLVFIVLMEWNIASVNIRGGTNWHKIERMIKECKNKDIILFQETNWTERIVEMVLPLAIQQRFIEIRMERDLQCVLKGKRKT